MVEIIFQQLDGEGKRSTYHSLKLNTATARVKLGGSFTFKINPQL
jgi:hypothetical protein